MIYTINKSKDTTRWVGLLPNWCLVSETACEYSVNVGAPSEHRRTEQRVIIRELTKRYNAVESTPADDSLVSIVYSNKD